MIVENFLWAERYRPKTVSAVILPPRLKKIFQNMVDTKQVSNLLFAGGPGIGKTTVAKAMLEEIGCDYIVENGSLNVNVDALRTRIAQFASSVSFKGGKKFVLIDEADNLSPAVQNALRHFIEQYSDNCGFILTCNYQNKIIDALISRDATINFKISKEEKQDIAKQYFALLQHILEEEKCPYDNKVLVQVMAKFFPDLRKTIGILQFYANSGSIDAGIFATFPDEAIKELIPFLRDKDFTSTRKWVGEHSDIEPAEFYTNLYSVLQKVVTKDTLPLLVLILADYQSRNFLDKEINITACLVEIMRDCSFV